MYHVNKQNITGLSVILMTFVVAVSVNAYQPDAPHQKAMQENAEAWKKEVQVIDKKTGRPRKALREKAKHHLCTRR